MTMMNEFPNPENPDQNQETEINEQPENPSPAGGYSVNDLPDDGGMEDPNSPDFKIASLEKETAELKDKLLRAMAEVENIRRRADKAREDMSKYAVSGFARELIEVADNLSRALTSLPEGITKDNDALKNFVEGIEATERQLKTAFDNAGIEKIEPLDEQFDPNRHRAMFEVADPSKPAGTIVQLVQPGYVIHNRLLREALVGVSKGGEQSAPKIDEEV